MSFDTKTLWVALAVSNMLFGLLMLAYANPGGDRSISRTWAIGQVVKGVAIVLIVLKTALPYPVSFVGNSLYMVGHFLELLAFLAYAGQSCRRGQALGVLLGLLALYNLAVGLIPFGAEPRHMAVLFSLSLCILYTLNALALLASGRRRSLVQRLLIASNGLIAVTALARALVAWLSESWDPHQGMLANQALFLAGFIFSISDGFGFLLLVKEDADRDLLRMATVDGLTGLANRMAFMLQAEDRRKLCLRTGQPISLLMMDVDNFKRINDVHGHATGDAVLRAIGELMRKQFRDVDVCGRLGGEEFAVVLPGTPVAAAMEVAERLRLGLAETPITVEGVSLRITASFGVADLASLHGLEQTMSLADQRLYQAKNLGRNRVVGIQPLA
ncbi:hypothetical protein A6A04_10340 [Paramagnetospirillum marisnigri]|uniref:diguanylate cyclase n=1 Tax=Paramagnetospirillum marisnigri TaxID=1285242 RepID=A0A178MXW5_9PROT|nr:GGDEF domain-containing protein [Paramagnetospirillum marisnigri]OAN55955.1 hypothetical protein A6A04_10340 [Paramagnetospirillum marisnigri]